MPAVDPVRQEFIDMYEETLIDLMENQTNRICRKNRNVLCASTPWLTLLCVCAKIWTRCWQIN